jgi:hypothetical protein
MRVRAAQNRGMHHPGAVNIADIFADAAQKPHVFFPFNSRADVGHGLFVSCIQHALSSLCRLESHSPSVIPAEAEPYRHPGENRVHPVL